MSILKMSSIGLMILAGLIATHATAATSASPVTMELEQAVHFLTPSGEDVVVESGMYQVEVAEEWLRLVPKGGERSDAVLLAASRSPHWQEITAPKVLSIRAEKDEESVWLLLPDGQSWTAKGSYSGVRTRHAGGDARLHFGYEYQGTPTVTYDQGEYSLGFCLMLVEKGDGGAFTWDSQKKSCRIFSSISVNQMVANPRFISGTRVPVFHKLDEITGAQVQVLWPEYNQRQTATEIYKNYTGAALPECQVWCAQDPRCNIFNWNKATKQCHHGIFKSLGNNPVHIQVVDGPPPNFSTPDNNYISGKKWTYNAGIIWVNLELTKHNLPKCVQVVLHGSTKQYITPIYGQGWNCPPVQLVQVHDNPNFRSTVFKALYRGLREKWAEDQWFNTLSRDLKLASSPSNTHLLIGYVSHPRSYEKNDVAYYVFAVHRVSAEEVAVHGSRFGFSAGGAFNTPILGELLEQAITIVVNYITQGIPFTGQAAAEAVKHLASQNASVTADRANKIVVAIALSAGSILPPAVPAVSGILPAVLLPLR